MDKLIIRSGGRTLREVPLTDDMSIGRKVTCTVPLEDQQISRVHAVIRHEGSGYLLEDRGSTNGTLHNGRKLSALESVRLADGDVVLIKPFELVFEIQAAAATALHGEPTLNPTPGAGGTERVAPVGPATQLPDFPSPAAPPRATPGRATPAPAPAAAAPAPAAAAPAVAPAAAAGASCRVRSNLIHGRTQLPVWSGESRLRVVSIIDETHDAKTFRMVGVQPLLFSYHPGQFLNLTLDIDGQTVKRSYSISSSPSRPHALEMTIKRVPGGLVSNWVADHLKVGSELAVRGPSGKFTCFGVPSPKMLMLAAGSGITPIMSMIRWLTDTAADVDVVLLYSVRTPSDVIFGQELEHLAARYPWLRVVITATQGRTGLRGWTGLSEKVDRRLLQLAVPDLVERRVYLCGPPPFAEALKSELASLGHPPEQYEFEKFGSPQKPNVAGSLGPAVAPAPPAAPAAPATAARKMKDHSTESYTYEELRELVDPARGRAAAPPPSPPPAAPPRPAPPPPPVAQPSGLRARFVRSGLEVIVRPGQTLLEAGEQAGLALEFSCREGQCATCETHCQSGTVQMADNSLSPADLARGQIYLCVARPTSDVVLDA
jgi:ferredoxin-NADP reductase/ferredoxin